MRVVVALGGNALLRRGQPLTAENQRENARAACAALAPLALEHELVISHGNGPQVGLLALQGSAYTAVETYPLDVLGAQTEGMIGYLLEQELGNELPFERHLATLLTMIEVDRDDPAFADPTKPIGPIYDAAEAAAPRSARRAGRSSPTATACAASSPRRCPSASSASTPIESLLEQGVVVICAGGGGIPTMYTDEPAPRRPAARRRRGGDRQGPRERAAGDRARRRRAADRHRRRRRLHRLGHARAARDPRRDAGRARRARDFAAGSMGPKVRAACWFAERTGGFAAIGSIHDTPGAAARRGRHPRRASQTAVHTG